MKYPDDLKVTLINGDCLEKLKDLPDNYVDSIVTDPPYGLSFMGKKWDYDVPSEEVWRECLRVLKPGGHLLAFAGTRTQHRMAVRIEDAGFEIRDMIAWIYGSGFPKSLNIGKAVDKLQGNEREVVGKSNTVAQKSSAIFQSFNGADGAELEDIDGNLPLTKGTSPHEGWGTALKPALEPITVARKPLGEKTVAENVLKYGTGGINIDESRVGTDIVKTTAHKTLGDGIKYGKSKPFGESEERTGRFPANLIHDGSEEVVELFPSNVKGEIGRAGRKSAGDYNASNYKVGVVTETGFKDSGSAARFFYCAKASKKDRDEGLDNFETQRHSDRVKDDGVGGDNPRNRTNKERQNFHPTVKPTDLMRYLCRLVTPPGGTVLDPFMGSGSTGKAAVKEGFSFIGIELDEEYVEIAKARIGI